MDSGARRLVLDVTEESDEGIVSYAFLWREYAFVEIAENVVDSNLLYPSGQFLICSVCSLREFVEQFPYLSKRELSLIAAPHGIKFRSRLTIKMCKDALRRHTCRTDCAGVVYKFRTLTRARAVAFVEPDPEPMIKPLTEVETIRHSDMQKRRVLRKKGRDAAKRLEQDDARSKSSVEYPPFRTNDEKLNIIREWQEAMNPDNLTRGVCAVCAQVFEQKSLHDITPTVEMLNSLRNERLPEETLPSTYDFELYHRAILHPRGMTSTDSLADLRMCGKCRSALVKKTPVLPKDAMANFQYYGLSEIPEDIKDAILTASPFEVMLVALCRATVVTHHYQSKTFRGGRLPEEASQRFNRGNVAILPQDPGALRSVLPPAVSDLEGSVCVVFAGGRFTPTKESLKRFAPVLVSKQKVRRLIEWLIANNEWYKSHGVRFSAENLAEVIEGVDDCGVLRGIQIHHLANEREEGKSVDWDQVAHDLVMENVAYTQGDYSYRSRQAMKATALAHALQNKPFLVSRSGSAMVSDDSPCLMSALFPHLDPWGIGGFNHPARSSRCRISLERQLKNLLRQVDSPFERDPLFAFVCWNMIQKRAVSLNTSFSISSTRRHGLVSDIMECANTIQALALKFEKNMGMKAETEEEKRVVRLFRELGVVAKNLQGSDGYKLCRRNEIRSLMRVHGTPTFFITLNPHDLSNVLVGHYGDVPPNTWRSMSSYQRASFVASHPAAAAKAFDVQVQAFLDIIVRFQRGPGLFGECVGYYATVEAQGRGTLHTHMLLWIEGNPNPERLRRMMHDDSTFQESVLRWLEDLISCELPGDVEQVATDVEKPRRGENMLDPRLEKPPQIAEKDDASFMSEFEEFVRRLAIECNWHEHTPTCFKHLAKGEQPSDSNCRMRIDGTVCIQSTVDPETESICLRRFHPWINNYNDVVLFLLQCNMDIKFIGSGPAAKALTYYISDYITKNELKVHVGLQAIQAAIESYHKRFADDSASSASTRERNLLTKTVNAMMGRREISHQQVMSYLVGGGDYYASHDFRTVRFYEFIDIAVKHELHVDQVCGCMEYGLTDCPDNLYGDTCMAYITKGSITVSTDTLDYIMRPSSAPFDDMSLWEFLEKTEKVRRTSTEQQEADSDDEEWDGATVRPCRAYTRRWRRPFADQCHPQYNTHELCLRNKHVVPVLLGESIPLPLNSDWRREAFSRAMLLLFCPWRRVSSLWNGYSCWTEAFDGYHFKERFSRLIENFCVELECKDSRDFHRTQYLTKKQKMAAGSVVFPVGDDCNDLEHLHVALEEDSDLDEARNLDDDIDTDVDDCEPSMTEMPEDEMEILTMTRALWIKPTGSETTGTDPCLVFRVTDQDMLRIKEHGVYMALQRKRKRPSYEPQSLDCGNIDRPIKRLCTSREGEPRLSLEHVGNVSDGSRWNVNEPVSQKIIKEIVHEWTLYDNPEQERAFTIVAEHMLRQDEEQMLMFVTGIGGSGKSHVIRAILDAFLRSSRYQEILVSAPTGSAACLIDGYTIHALTLMGVGSRSTVREALNETHDGKVAKQKINVDELQQIWCDVKYLVLDEVSMVSAELLSNIADRLSLAKSGIPTAKDKPFGGINMIFAGDMAQLRPVKGSALYARSVVSNLTSFSFETIRSQERLFGAFLWRSLTHVVQLIKNERAKTDPNFIQLLGRVRVGETITSGRLGLTDIDVLNNRLLSKLMRNSPEEFNAFRDAPVVFGERRLRNLWNEEKAKEYAASSGHEFTYYYAQHFSRGELLTGEDDNRLAFVVPKDSKDYLGRLPLLPGMPVLITENLALAGKVVNGARGTIKSIAYHVIGTKRVASCVYVEVPASTLHLPGEGDHVVAVLPQNSPITYTSKHGAKFNISRRQVPIVPGWAFTDYKAQGTSLQRAIVDIASARNVQHGYVMLS